MRAPRMFITSPRAQLLRLLRRLCYNNNFRATTIMCIIIRIVFSW